MHTDRLNSPIDRPRNPSSILRLPPNGRTTFVVLSMLLSLSPLSAQVTGDTGTARSASPEEETITLSPFDISTTKDKGYRASNSVSGSRIDTPIKDLPFAIQAFTSEFIQDVRPASIIDLVRYAPGVSAQNNGFTTGDTQINLRGFSAGIFAYPLRDGLAGPQTFSFNATERVEVIKGPASFLYGQIAPGGIVNVITKTPLQKFENTLSVTGGTDNYFQNQKKDG